MDHFFDGGTFEGPPPSHSNNIKPGVMVAKVAERSSPMPPQPQSPAKSTALLAEALSKAQGEIAAPLKRRKVDFTNNKGQRVRYNYADLADVIECIKAPLAKNGLSIAHQLEYLDSGRGAWYGLTTRLMHSSGEYLTCWYPLPDPVDKDIKAQEFGSALTYARRYSLSSLLGIASEEDDDAEEAPPVVRTPSPRTAAAQPMAQQQRPVVGPAPVQPQPQPQAPKPVSMAQLTRLFTIATQRGWSNEQVKLYLESRLGLTSTKDLTREQYDNLVSTIETMDYQKAVMYGIK